MTIRTTTARYPYCLALLALSFLVDLGLSAEQAHAASGAVQFAATCAVCHRANGAGTPGLAPPLTHYPALFSASNAGRRQLIDTVLYGMFGDITVDERHYNFKMPGFASLDDAALAAMLNHVIFDLATAPTSAPQSTLHNAPLTAAEVATERAQVLDGAAVHKHRAEVVASLGP